jgi:NDP-sugar pyrophosphorylase family protein
VAPRYASVYPLVPSRAVARPFTYLAEGLHKGSIVTVPFGRARRRGVVVEEGAEVRDAVLLHDSYVGARARVTRAIVDEEANVGEDTVVGGIDEITVVAARLDP